MFSLSFEKLEALFIFSTRVSTELKPLNAIDLWEKHLVLINVVITFTNVDSLMPTPSFSLRGC